MSYLLTWAKQIFCFRLSCIVSSVVLKLLALKNLPIQHGKINPVPRAFSSTILKIVTEKALGTRLWENNKTNKMQESRGLGRALI